MAFSVLLSLHTAFSSIADEVLENSYAAFIFNGDRNFALSAIVDKHTGTRFEFDLSDGGSLGRMRRMVDGAPSAPISAGRLSKVARSPGCLRFEWDEASLEVRLPEDSGIAEWRMEWKSKGSLPYSFTYPDVKPRAVGATDRLYMPQRTFDRALKAYPDATILFAGWDFYATWTPEELRAYWPTLDWNHVVIFDYEANAYRKSSNGTHADFTEWGLTGKYPYTFGTFFYEPSSMIHTDYDLIAKRRQAVEGDPMCKGNILWPEAAHTDILELRYFTENAWCFSSRPVDAILADFCRDRYGEQACRFEAIWKRVIPLSVKCAVFGPWGGMYGKMLVDRIAGFPRRTNDKFGKRACFRPRVAMSEFAEASAIFADLAKIDWQGEHVRRDALDLARTLGDRLLCSAISETQNAYLDWAGGLRDDTDAILADADRAIAMAELMSRTLALHEDFSLWETLRRTDAIEHIRLPEFDKILVQNAMNAYCASHQAEAAEHLYVPMLHVWRNLLARKFASGERRADVNPTPMRDLVDAIWKRNLEEMRPTASRTPTAYARTMNEWSRFLCESYQGAVAL